MIQRKPILVSFIILSWIFPGTPLEYALQFTTGYDSNVMRFSADEYRQAAPASDVMGGADTFDSFVYKLGLSGEKTLWNSRKKLFIVSGNIHWADYRHHPQRKYGSGGFHMQFKWGSYKNIKYSLRHLDRFYLRHYINRDISNTFMESCAFTDQNQSITFTQRVGRREWFNLSAGFLQRYYDRPFTEFDLDITYIRGKINKRFNNFGTVAFQFERGIAENITFGKTAKASELDRSYKTMEWYMPIRIQKRIPFLNEVGISARTETRIYVAEDPDDPLHSGRNHLDTKYDLWLKKSITEIVNVTLTGRYRTRVTNSGFEWVEDLKSFQLLQMWCKIEWDLIYDRY
ncbi:MAG: hypothetical protein QGG04_00235 [Candidatus Marinimicrobia bacterium]|nr:hypothetical protein [Candidatus Neomarinimicrobiota bacterium]